MYSLFISCQNVLARLLRHEDRGATAVEYGLIVALIATAIVIAVKLAGQQVVKAFTTVTGDF
jgi:pilus assembly protein Flp/PilA